VKDIKNKNALRSVRMLEEAYVELLSEKDPDKITVSDIARKADLNRGTFYAHFDDIHDLERSLTDEMLHRLTVILSEVVNESFLENPRPILDRIGEFLTENRDVIQRFVLTGKLLSFFNMMEDRLREQTVEKLEQEHPDDVPFILFVADYVVGGILHTYESWLNSHEGSVSIDVVNDNLEKLVRSTGKFVKEETCEK
jgi:AcrR family transcriptional regulator